MTRSEAHKPLRAILLVLLFVLAPMAMLYTLWANPLSAGEDDLIYYYPLRTMTADALRQGQWPVYNSLEATGVPLMADPQSAVMHPTTWLFVWLDPKLAYTLSLMIAFSLAGGGAYVYLRRLGLLPAAAVLGGLAFMFCGFMVGHRVHQSVILAAAMLPWGLWCIEGLRCGDGKGGWLRPMVCMAVVGFLTIASGHWPTLIHLVMIWGVYLLLRARPLLRALAVSAGAMALAAVLAGPQLYATGSLLASATREKLPYSVATENSFLPISGVLAMFPHLMGSRTPNLFPQSWWGPGHLCETLGYVGLLTLGLALAAIWRLYRRPRRDAHGTARAAQRDARMGDLSSIVRPWTWIIIAAAIFMLGGYLPTYRLVYMIPGVGVVRCPARMILAVDMALATLAAVAVHAALTMPRQAARIARLRRSVSRSVSFFLPAVMLVAVALLAALGVTLEAQFPQGLGGFFSGTGRDMVEAVSPANPAVWTQLLVLVATILAVRYWLKRPRRRVVVLVLVLLADLFLITRFVDVPRDWQRFRGANDQTARALVAASREEARPQTPRPWHPGDRIFALGLPNSIGQLSAIDRADELLLPKTCERLGVATIANYGPFQSPLHSHAFGFRPWGFTREWAWLIRRNHLLSVYGVRYILSAAPEQWAVIESVRIPAGRRPPPGPEILTGVWDTHNVTEQGTVLKLRASAWAPWDMATATQAVRVEPGRWYRIAMDARGPDGGLGGWLRAEVALPGVDLPWDDISSMALSVEYDQSGPDWRHYEWTFRVPPGAPAGGQFKVWTASDRLAEVRNVSLRPLGSSPTTAPATAASAPDDEPCPVDPINLGQRLQPGEAVYELVATVPAAPADGKPRTPVRVYRNKLCPATPPATIGEPLHAAVDTLKWAGDDLQGAPPQTVPSISIPAPSQPAPIIIWMAFGAAALLLAVSVKAFWPAKRLVTR